MRVIAPILCLVAACSASPSGKSADPVVMGNASPPAAAAAKVGATVELLVEPLGQGHLRVGLHNAGTAPVRVATHIATHEWQSDWLSIEIGGRKLGFTDSRDKSAPVYVDLAAGATDWQDVDVAAWAARSINGGTALTAGHHDVTVIYESREDDPVWRGTLTILAGLDV